MYSYELPEEIESLSESRAPELLQQVSPHPAWVTWRPSPYHRGRGGQPITAIIYHFTAGPSLRNTVRWFSNNPRRVSAHYVIGKTGQIVQMVPLNRSAHHAGPSILGGRRGVNRLSIGVEIVNWGRLTRRGSSFFTHSGRRYTGPTPIRARGRYWEPFTDAQYRALIRLTRYLVSRFPTITHITGHEDIALPRGRKSDPGGAFDWNRIRAALRPAFRGRIGPLRATTVTPTAPTRLPVLRLGSRGRAGPPVTTELNERYEGEIDYENVPLSAADSSLVTRVVPADIRKVVRNADGSLRTRSRSDITHVVIHSLAGRYARAVENWRTGRRLFKPHYVIREDGEITQVVAERHIPQHGNRANSYSVGIEHDGFTKDPSYLTDAMYVASAALTRDICLRNGIPMDRTHIIGHDEAPGTGHGDPGGYWDWDYYLALVRWDGHAATRPIRLVIDYNSYSFWPTSDHWRPWSRTPIRHNPHPKHSWGPKYYRAQPARDATDAAVFLADIPVTGTYELSAWWPVLSSNNPEVMIKVLAGHQFKPVFSTQVNQKTRSGRVRRTLALPNTPIWYRLGSVTANTGDTVWVEVSRRSSQRGWIVADAVRLLKK